MSAASSTRRGAATRGRLIRASERLFSEEGFDAVSVRSINVAAGLGSASVHYHFGSKEALLEAVLLEQGAAVRERMRQRLRALADAAEAPTGRQLVEAIAVPYLEQIEREPARGRRWVRIVALIMHSRSELLEQLGQGVFAELLGQVRRAFPAAEVDVLARRWQLAAEVLIQMLGDADRRQFDELVGFVAGGVEAQLRPTPC